MLNHLILLQTGLFQYVDHDGREITPLSFEIAIWKLRKEINEEQKGKFTSGYLVSVNGPLNPKVFRSLKGRILGYIETGKVTREPLDFAESLEPGEKALLARENNPKIQELVKDTAIARCRVFIEPINEPKQLELITGLGGAQRLPNSNELVANLAAMLDYGSQRILEAKLPRLANIQGYSRKVLLIWSAVPIVEIDDIRASFSRQRLGAGEVDAVYFLEYDWSVHLLANFSLPI